MRTVFVIDDDHLMREVLSRVIEKSGYRVRGFQSPLQALPLMDSAYPDAVVSDVQMPGMTGIDFAREVRDRGIAVPVILVTADPSANLEARARDFAVSDVFEKPIRDVARFSAAVDRVVSAREDEEGRAGLDRLRMSFLTGLAHELRTPLTAMKLALDSLLAARTADLFPSDALRSGEGRLLAIGQRNLDRIVRLVEGQLDLFQITLGDVSGSRRLVSIQDLVERAVADTQPAVRRHVQFDPDETGDPIFMFTDSDRLRAVIRHLLEGPRADEACPVRIGYSLVDGSRVIEIGLQNLRDPFEGRGETFESRAFRRIVASFDGEIGLASSASEPRMSLRLPVLPRFDAREDFTVPLTSLREAAMLSGRTIAVLKCALKDHRPSGSCFSPGERSFFQRASAALSEGDTLIRARSEGSYYLLLVERSPEEISRIAEFLRTDGSTPAEAACEVEETLLSTLSGEEPKAGIRSVVEDVEQVC